MCRPENIEIEEYDEVHFARAKDIGSRERPNISGLSTS
jgi:hypothetical protein